MGRQVHDLPFLDPFSPRETIRYRANADGFLLYSIGRDGKDDAGTPMNAGHGDLTLWNGALTANAPEANSLRY